MQTVETGQQQVPNLATLATYPTNLAKLVAWYIGAAWLNWLPS
jgi:hypothetical protein